jgi:hypothetical protein
MPDTLTWSALLARWTEFAASAVALPDSGEPGRWKRAVPQIVTLQAVVHALDELDELEPEEIPVALDRAALAVREAVRTVQDIWDGDALPPEAQDLCDESEAAIILAESIGLAWTVAGVSMECAHPASLSAAIEAIGIADTVLVPTPGVPLFRSSVAAHFRPAVWDPDRIAEVAELIETSLDADGDAAFAGFIPQMQVYRQFDFARGGPVRDLVVPTALGVAAGQPLLIPAVSGGRIMPVTLPPRRSKSIDPVPVEFVSSAEDME